MFSPGWTEMVILGFIALMLFGKRLPEVARSLGQGFVEFKKGISGFENEMKSSIYSEPAPRPSTKRTNRVDEDLRPTGEKFEAPPEPATDEAAPANAENPPATDENSDKT